MSKVASVNFSRYYVPVQKNNVTPVNFGRNNLKLIDRRILKLSNQVSTENLHHNLDIIAGPAMEGRGVGQPGIEKAKQYIENQFKDIGLVPLGKANLTGFSQKFNIKKYLTVLIDYGQKDARGYVDTFSHNIKTKTSNVIGIIEGKKSKDEYLLISAHYDHLGKTENNVIFPGADDDASGIVALMEIARVLKKTHPKKTIVFAALSGEESGHNGAKALCRKLKQYGLTKQIQVLNLEMLAGQKGDSLDAWSKKQELSKNIFDNLKHAGVLTGTNIKIHSGDPGSDAETFNDKGMPSVCVAWDYYTRGTHPHYHRTSDTVDSVNFDILNKTTRTLTATSYLLANKVEAHSSKIVKHINNVINFVKSKLSKKTA